MKKILVLLILVSGVVIVASFNQHLPEVPRHLVKTVETPRKSDAIRKSQAPSVNVAVTQNTEQAFDIPSAHQFEREYLGQTEIELSAALKNSETVLSQKNLINKANQGRLDPQEKALLVQEMRRQGVLSHLLVELKIKRLKEKYL